MAKFDKDTLIKNRFWIMLGGAALLLLVCWLVLMLGGAGADQEKKFKQELTKVQANAKGTPKNPNFEEPWRKYGEEFTKQKEAVWRQAWEKQADMYQWPSNRVFPGDRLKYYDDRLDPLGDGSSEARKE